MAKRKPLSFNNEKEYSLKERAKKMDVNYSADSTSKMDQSTRDLLLQEGSDLTLQKAIDTAGTDELSQAQLETMVNEDASINRVNQ